MNGNASTSRIIEKGFLLVALILAALFPIGCNVAETRQEYRVNIKVSPELSVDSGVFDMIRVDILNEDQTVFRDSVYYGEWRDDGSHQIKNVNLGSNPPLNYILKITAYKNDTLRLQYSVKVANGVKQNSVIIVDERDTLTLIPDDTTANPDTTNKPEEQKKIALDAGQDRNIKVGEEVTFEVRVTQFEGLIEVLKWDLNADGIYEDSVKSPEALPKHRYTKAGEFTASFFTRDSKGNLSTLSLRVRVGSSAPFVVILSPSQDTAITESPITVKFSSDSASRQKKIDLVQGWNSVIIADTGQGGIGKDSVRIFLDSIPPTVKIVTPLPSTTSIEDTVDVEWAVDDRIQTSKTREILPLGDGLKTITRSAKDSLGNTGFAFVTIRLDKTPPSPPIFTHTTTPSPTRTKDPIWAWQGAGGGSGIFRYQWGTEPAMEGRELAYAASNLPDGFHTITVAEKDTAGNWSAPVSRGIRVKNSPPAAPALTSKGSPTKAPRWEWVSGGGGDGWFRFKLDSANYPEVGSMVNFYAPTDIAIDGSHTLCVQERDTVGWGAEKCLAVVVDKNPPNLKISDPLDEADLISSSNPVISGTVFDYSIEGLRYTVNKGISKALSVSENSWAIGENYDDGDHWVHIYAKDKAGNPEAVDSILIHKRSKVIFVRKGSGGTGKSWSNAYGELSFAINDARTNNPGTQIWVSQGTYTASIIDGFTLKTKNSIYGGFQPDGKGWDLNKRNLVIHRTILLPFRSDTGSVVTLGSPDGNDIAPRDSNVVDGFFISSKGLIGWNQTNTIEITNCEFSQVTEMPINIYSSGKVTISNTLITGNAGGIGVQGGEILVDNLISEHNLSGWGSHLFWSQSLPLKLSIQNSKFLDKIGLMVWYQSFAEIKNTTICGGTSVVEDQTDNGIVFTGITDACQ